MTYSKLIVIGASAGGVEAVSHLLSGLSGDFPAPVFVVLHLPASQHSYLPEIFSRAGPLPAKHPESGEAIEPGQVYVAPPDHHMLIDDGHILITKGPRENRFRPSVNALFRSAAYLHGPQVIGVVLSGLLDDGTSGLWTIKRLGGAALVQQPQDAEFDDMPRNAIAQVAVDQVLPVSELAASLTRLVKAPPEPEVPVNRRELERLAVEVQIAGAQPGLGAGVLKLGEPSILTCPECHGTLLQIERGRHRPLPLSYRPRLQRRLAAQ